MYSCESWTIKKAECQRTDAFELVLEKTESLGLQGNQSWIFTGRTDAKALIPWPPDAKSWLIGKDPDAGKVWGQKGVTEDGIIGCPQWTWVGENCRRRWRARKLGVLQSIGSQSQTQLSNWTRQVTYLLTVEIFIFPNHNLKILEGDTATDVKILTGLLAKLKPSIPF